MRELLKGLWSLWTGYFGRIRTVVLLSYGFFYVIYGVLVTALSVVRFVWFLAYLLCCGVGLDLCGRTGGPEDWKAILDSMASVVEDARHRLKGPRR